MDTQWVSLFFLSLLGLISIPVTIFAADNLAYVYTASKDIDMEFDDENVPMPEFTKKDEDPVNVQDEKQSESDKVISTY